MRGRAGVAGDAEVETNHSHSFDDHDDDDDEDEKVEEEVDEEKKEEENEEDDHDKAVVSTALINRISGTCESHVNQM